MSGGPSLIFGEPANPQYASSASRLGGLGAAAVTYRSAYFIDPVLEVGYAWLARGQAELPDGPWGAGGALEQKLGSWVISPGVSTQIWRLRPRLGLGLAIVTQSNSFRGERGSTLQLAILSQLALDFNLLDLQPVQLDVGTRFVMARGAGIEFLGVGVVARIDLVSFGEQ